MNMNWHLLGWPDLHPEAIKGEGGTLCGHWVGGQMWLCAVLCCSSWRQKQEMALRADRNAQGETGESQTWHTRAR